MKIDNTFKYLNVVFKNAIIILKREHLYFTHLYFIQENILFNMNFAGIPQSNLNAAVVK